MLKAETDLEIAVKRAYGRKRFVSKTLHSRNPDYKDSASIEFAKFPALFEVTYLPVLHKAQIRLSAGAISLANDDLMESRLVRLHEIGYRIIDGVLRGYAHSKCYELMIDICDQQDLDELVLKLKQINDDEK